MENHLPVRSSPWFRFLKRFERNGIEPPNTRRRPLLVQRRCRTRPAWICVYRVSYRALPVNLALETPVPIWEFRCNCRPRLLLVHPTLFSGGLDMHRGAVHIFRILRVFSIAHCVCFFYRRATFGRGAFRCLVNPSRLHLLFSHPTTNARFLLPSVRAALLTTNLFTCSILCCATG